MDRLLIAKLIVTFMAVTAVSAIGFGEAEFGTLLEKVTKTGMYVGVAGAILMLLVFIWSL